MGKLGRPPKSEADKLKKQMKEVVANPDELEQVAETNEVSEQEDDEDVLEVNPTISSGADLFDLALGGGYAIGKIINIVGDNSTGKTLLAMETIAHARRTLGPDKVRYFYDDAEAGFSFDSEKMYGFQIIDEDKGCSEVVEDLGANLTRELEETKEDQILIYVLDSLDALSSNAEVARGEVAEKLAMKDEDDDDGEDKKQKGSYDLERQKKLSQFFRLKKRQIKSKKCIFIVISQVRMNVGKYGPKFVRTGGKALDFYASQIIWLNEVEKHEKKGRPTGVTIRAKVTKNKIGKPFRDCYIDLVFDYGLDSISSNLNFLYSLKTDTGKQKKAEVIEWDGNKYRLPQLINFIEKNNLEEELKNRVAKKWNDIEEAISSDDRKRKWE